MNASIIVPAYNEEGSVEQTIDLIHDTMDATDHAYELIVVNDGSTDRTGEILAERDDIELINHRGNRGYGASLKNGIRQSQYETLVITDADGTYPIDEIPTLLADMDEYDMVVGARTGANVEVPLIRKPAKWFLRKLANFLVDQEIPDLNSGLRAFRKDLAEEHFHIFPSGFSFTTTITLAFLSDDYLVKYVPVDYFDREGESKIDPVRDFINFNMLIMRTIMYFNPLRVFLPVTLLLGAVSLTSLLYDALVVFNISQKSLLLTMTTVLLFSMGIIADLIVKHGHK